MRFPGRAAAAEHGSTGVCLRADGICLVHLDSGRETPPRLTVCEFLAGDEAEALTAGLAMTVKRHGLARTPVTAVLEHGSYSLYQLEPPDVPADELAEAVRWSIKDLLDFPVEAALVDLFPLPYDDQRSRSRMAQVVAARLPEVRRLADLLLGARLKISAIDITELAIRNIVALLPEDSRGLVFLHLGAHQGLISVFRDAKLYLTRNLGIGCLELNRLSAGETANADPAAPSMPLAALLDSIVLEVQRSLDFYESSFSQAAIDTLVIGPLEAPVPELLPYLRRALGVAVRSLDLGSVLDCRELPMEAQARALPAIGGALRRE